MFQPLWSTRYFSAPASSDPTFTPPFDSTNFVITGTNLPAISGESPSDLKAPATEVSPPTPPGKAEPAEPSTPPLDLGAAFSNPSIPGTAFATRLNSLGVNRLLARPKSAPAPPVACFGEIESSLMS